MSTVTEKLPDFIRALLKPSAYSHPCSKIELVETHISWVLLTGEIAYKVKKPVDFGFLDFSTLQERQRICKEEVRLNSRTAPDIYLGVVSLHRSGQTVSVEGSGKVFEYAVKMRQFDQDRLLDRQLEQGLLTSSKMDQLADVLASFHNTIAVSKEDDEYGTPSVDHSWAMENFQQLENLVQDPKRLRRIQSLKSWTQSKYQEISETLSERKQGGFVRECHGDLHLRNITEIDDSIVLFDAIEFNPQIRWIDVINEIAFLFTDLEHRQRSDLAWRVLNRYLEKTGDYRGLRVFRYYSLYRIMVRAKIDSLRLNQDGLDSSERQELEQDLDVYLAQGERTVSEVNPSITLMRGLSGSGKSYISQRLLEQCQMIRLRSDVERKRLKGMQPEEKTLNSKVAEVYGPQSSRETFEKLLELSRCLTYWGFAVVVDATFLQIHKIEPYLNLSLRLHLPFRVLDLQAPEPILRERIRSRNSRPGNVSDATENVLASQLKDYSPLEGSYVVAVDTSLPIDFESLKLNVTPEKTRSQHV